MMQRYTEEQVEELLRDAASSPTHKQYSHEEVAAAAREAGIPEERFENAAKRLHQRRGLRLGLATALVSCIAVALVLILRPPTSLGGWHEGALTIHNEHRLEMFEVEILVPSIQTLDCALDPSARAARNEFDSWRRVVLLPGTKLQLDVPPRPQSCPIIWVKTHMNAREVDTATFELPVALEIERSGRLDQKGLGRPKMHAPPEGSRRELIVNERGSHER